MESLLNRYRNITVLLLVIMAQLVLLAVDTKVKGVPLIRVWAVTAVTPVARVLEGIRGGGSGFLHNYILLHDANQENHRLKAELDRLKLENIELKNDLNTAERARALQVFQEKTPSKTVAATIIATGAGANSRVVFVDRGSVAGVLRGMPVVTPDGIVGKVIQAYPIASEVLLITDPDFAAGVMTQKGVRGNLKGQGTTQCRVDYVPFEDKVEVGEIFYTSGDDRVFPRGFPAGVVKSVRAAQPFKEIMLEPTGLQKGLEDVLILIQGVHQAIPESPPASQPMYIAPAPPATADGKPPDAAAVSSGGTEADRLRSQYKALGESQNHNFGENPAGSKAVDFTRLGAPPNSASPQGPPKPPAANPAPSGTGTAPPQGGASQSPPHAPAPKPTGGQDR
jgi:rod shape-determining protein MreC